MPIDAIAKCAHKSFMASRVQENADERLVARVTETGCAQLDLTDEEVERLGCGPFSIAYALGRPAVDSAPVAVASCAPRD